MKACHDCVHTRYAICRKHRTKEANDAQLKRVRAYMMGRVAEYLFLPNSILQDMPRAKQTYGAERGF